MIKSLKIYSPLFVPILAGYLVLYKRHHIYRIFDGRSHMPTIRYKKPVFHEKPKICLECSKISKTEVCFSCWIKIAGYPESTF